jgi:flavin-binding protein dodecin
MLAPPARGAALTLAGLRWLPGIGRATEEERTMSVAKIIEVNASSKTSMEDAVKVGLKKTSETVKNIKGAWVNEIKVVTDDGGNVTEWRVNLRISFVVT